MGNWRRRQPRRFYRQEKFPSVSPLPYHPEPPPSSEFWKDGIPSWEKKYCTLVGSLPWWKIVDSKKYMHGNNIVINWDDSAGEEAFHNAKKRFWSDINGLTCDISLPDPNIYVDEIDWNPSIDPELIKELDREYFAPDEGEGQSKFGRTNKKTKYSVPDGHNRVPDNLTNPWEYDNLQDSEDLKNIGHGRNQWNTNCINDSTDFINGDNPWERGITQGNGSVDKNAWEDSRDKSWGWNQMGDDITRSKDWDTGGNPWESGCQGVASMKVNRWGDPISKSWGCNQQDSKNADHGENPWERGLSRNSKALKDRGWKDCGGNELDWKQWESHNKQKNNLDFRIISSSWRARNDSVQRREHPHQYISGYNKSSRVQGSDYQTGSCWRRGNNKKRGSFGYE